MEFLRPKDVIAKMKICRSSLYNLVSSGHFPRPVKVNDKITVWTNAEVETVMEALYHNVGEEEIKALVREIEVSRLNRRAIQSN